MRLWKVSVGGEVLIEGASREQRWESRPLEIDQAVALAEALVAGSSECHADVAITFYAEPLG